MTKRALHPHDSGVYAAPADMSAARAGFAAERDLWRSLDLRSARDKSALLSEFARALEFPADFGHNWDALADSLQDLSWLRWSRLAVEIRGSEAFRRHAADDWNTALDILRDAAKYWGSHHRSLVVLVDGASDLPALRV